jgi:serine/threonine-protein kinase
MPPQLGPYVVLESCGPGRVGTAYRAFDVKAEQLVRLTVLEWPIDHAVGDAAWQSLEEWLSLRVGRAHAHLGAIYAVGQGDFEGQAGPVHSVYVAAQWVKGETLQARLNREGAVEVAVATAWTAQILSALDHLHRLGIVEAALDPRHILVTDTGEICLLEAGLVTDGRFPWLEEARRTDTVPYRAPECVAGGRATIRSDLYATGVLLRRMLGGAACLVAVPAIDALIARATAAEPLERFASASEFIQALPSPISSASATASTPPRGISKELLDPIEAAFAEAVGPMAGVLARAALAAAQDADHLTRLLSGHIQDPVARGRFAAAAARVLGHPSAPATASAAAGAWPLTQPTVVRLTARLAEDVGPMARWLVERAAASATSRADFTRRLIDAIPEAKRTPALRAQLLGGGDAEVGGR